jgi:hypothetical protein
MQLAAPGGKLFISRRSCCVACGPVVQLISPSDHTKVSYVNGFRPVQTYHQRWRFEGVSTSVLEDVVG